ncbi:MAG: hypothetical protein GYB64_05590 [Chloroflexi bacterium]|nr:hypothetical protein [Chloroflexota bacterium]
MTTSILAIRKFEAPNPDAEVLGYGLSALGESITRAEFEHMLDKYGLTEIDPQAWYPLQTLLDMYAEMDEDKSRSMQYFVSIGMKVVHVIPEHIASIPEALDFLNAALAGSMRHYAVDTYNYRIETVEEGHARVIDYTPFPHDLIYGYMYAIANTFSGEGRSPTVVRTYLNEDDPDSDGAVYDIQW